LLELVTYDLAIFGSGFAAYELARVFAERGQSVAGIEKGTEEPSPSNQDMSRVPYRREPIVSGGSEFGAQVPPAFESSPRYVGLGGTSELWSGKWRRLDRVDVERSHDGRRWRVAYSELEAYYDKVAADYGWPDWSGDASARSYSELVSAHGLRLVETYEEVPPLRLRPKWNELRHHGSVDVLCGARAEEFVFDTGRDRLDRVHLVGEEEHVVSAGQFVVACGGIESVHLSHQLRASCRSRPRGPLPETYGGLVDHPKALVGEIVPNKHEPLLEYLQRARSQFKRLFAIALPEDDVAAAHLGNHTVSLWPSEPPGPDRPLRMMIYLEQFPERDNFIATMPTPAVSWRLSRRTWADCQAFLAIFVPRLAKLIGPVTLYNSVRFRGASHHAGALPMGEPCDGHVNRDCRFHDVDNLYCVSSAVFPVAGSASPTMTVVALARRLADHLQNAAP
jgi:choline dehydrogenase-like flavoprotein